ncbi:MAG: heavy metal-binding domain-containing protein [Kiritimatiellia bacterium]|jgi:uncharacterized protein YbjQ (UPF0145 family)|nr:heavy metal-binding domain-containing protein [Kiritimatiellia bacterium]MDP6848759.1 heavy metal-binding domain-containing protein [Kiritimatiellia bacterium]
MPAIILNLGVPIGFIAITMIIGMILEKRHFRRIEAREERFADMPVLNGKQFPLDRPVLESRLVSGSVVVSIDYFKRFLASLRNIFGGEVRSYCSLLDRGRREAILRMKEQFPDADLVINLRVETSSISQGKKETIGSTEVLAYGTAMRFADYVEQ